MPFEQCIRRRAPDAAQRAAWRDALLIRGL